MIVILRDGTKIEIKPQVKDTCNERAGERVAVEYRVTNGSWKTTLCEMTDFLKAVELSNNHTQFLMNVEGM